MDEVIERTAAQEELDRIKSFYEISGDEDEIQKNTDARLIAAIQKGRIILDEDLGVIVMTLVSPIKKENGDEIKELTFREPTAKELKIMDRYKENEKMAKAIHLASQITGEPLGVIERMGSRDLSTTGAITALFF